MTDAKNTGKMENKRVVDRTALFELFLATNPRTKRDVLYRRVQPNALQSIEATQFKESLSVLAMVNVTGVLPIRTVKPVGGTVVVYIDDTDGKNIIGELEQGSGGRELIKNLRRVARTLDQLHGMGHIHGDIRPTNIFASEDKQLCVSDFAVHHALLGWTKFSHPLLRESAPAIVRAPWTAPEIRRGGEVTAACDQYALAAILAAVVLGRIPAPGDSLLELLNADGDDFGSDRMLTRAPISKALSDDPAERFVTCMELMDKVMMALDSKTAGKIRNPATGFMIRAGVVAAVPLIALVLPFVTEVFGVDGKKELQDQIAERWQTTIGPVTSPRSLPALGAIEPDGKAAIARVTAKRVELAKEREGKILILQDKARETKVEADDMDYQRFAENASFDVNGSEAKPTPAVPGASRFMLVQVGDRVNPACDVAPFTWNFRLSFATPPNHDTELRLKLVGSTSVPQAITIKSGADSASAVVNIEQPVGGKSRAIAC